MHLQVTPLERRDQEEDEDDDEDEEEDDRGLLRLNGPSVEAINKRQRIAEYVFVNRGD